MFTNGGDGQPENRLDLVEITVADLDHLTELLLILPMLRLLMMLLLVLLMLMLIA